MAAFPSIQRKETEPAPRQTIAPAWGSNHANHHPHLMSEITAAMTSETVIRNQLSSSSQYCERTLICLVSAMHTNSEKP